MIRFKQFMLYENITKKEWNDYIKRNKELNIAVEVLRTLEKHGKAYIVGGAVRDIVLGKEPDDIDIATNVPMEKIEELFKTHDIGKNKDFGIVVIDYKGYSMEIAQFRKDGSYSDGRRPDKILIVPDFKEKVKKYK
jgi:tRNA nucleotidyltransferase (CCA-adding enzyme)